MAWPRQAMTVCGVGHAASAIAGGGVVLIWPALANGYPLVFSDTGTFLQQLLVPLMNWDKPWIYGPVIVLLSLKLTLWLPILAQGACVSWVLWLVQRVFGTPSPASHLSLCLLLAIGSAAPWFTSLVMPDVLAPLTVLLLFLLAFDPVPRGRWAITALSIFAIAAHLAHLIIAAACLAVVLVLRPRAFLRTALPLAAAIMLLLATNLAGHGRLSVSPYGSVIALARLVADGPATAYLERNCPAAGYRICDWKGRLPNDAAAFLWDPAGPVWTYPGGPIALAPEASRIVIATMLSSPWPVARAALGNWFTQLHMLRLDDVVGANALDATVGAQLRAYYPPAEYDRYAASAQRTDGLRGIAAPLQTPMLVVLCLGAIASLALMFSSRRRDRTLFALIALIAAGVLSNAFATGSLAGPHDRYQARIAWLLLLPPAIYAMRWFGGDSDKG